MIIGAILTAIVYFATEAQRATTSNGILATNPAGGSHAKHRLDRAYRLRAAVRPHYLVGFAAANWRKGDLDQLHEWGLGGRRFGTMVTWFLVGGDLYTAYTFIAVPALAFGAGAVAFFAVPYTIVIYPILFLVFPRLWHVCHKHGYITSGDFVRGRFGNRWLALAVTVTGIVATMPYIALQLVGIQVVVGALGISGTGIAADLPLIIAFVILAAFTYSSGLRAPASIAIVKDILIYITAFAVIVVIPIELGGFGKIFAAIPESKLLLPSPGENTTGAYSAYATLALGSALALFLYPHSLTGILSANSGHAIRRNAAMLPGYSFMLGLLALFGFFAIAAGVADLPNTRQALKSLATTSQFRRSFFTAFHHGLSDLLSPRSELARLYQLRLCRSPPPIFIRAIFTVSSSTKIRPTGKKRRWRNGCR